MIKKLFRRFLENKLVSQMVFVVASSIAVIILFLTGILSYYYESLSCKEIYRNASNSINQAANIVQFLSESANSILLQVSKNSEVNKLFMSKEYDAYDIYQASKVISNIRLNNEKIYSIYVVDEKNGYIFDSGENTMAFQNNRDNFYDESFLDCLDHMDEMKVFSPVIRTVPVIRNNTPERSTKVFTYFYFEPYFSQSTAEKNNIIAINVSTTWMSDALGYYQGAISNVNSITIVDRNGEIIFDKDSTCIGTQYAKPEVLERILSENDNNGYFVDDSEGKNLVTYTVSDYYGYEDWIFISENNYKEITGPIEKTKKLMYFISFLVMLVSIGSLLIILRRFFNPIKIAVNKAKLLEKERAEKQVRDVQIYLRQILEGDIGEDKDAVQNKFEQMQIDYDFARENQIVLVSIDNLQSLRRKFRDDFFRIIKEINDMVEMNLKQYFDKEIEINLMDGKGAFILCLKEEDLAHSEQWIQEIYQHVNSELGDKYQCTMSFAISSVGESIRDLPFLLAEVQEIQTYRYIYGYGKLLTAEIIKGHNADSFVYPKEQEKEILGNLYSGKLLEVQESYEKFLKLLMEMPVGEIKISLLLLAYGVKYASKNTTIETSSFLLNFDQFFAKIQSLETIDEVNNLFQHLFAEMVEVLESQRSAKYDEMIGFMKKQIEADYGLVDMSIKEIADKVDMSAAYLGRIFKQHTGVAFTEYLTKYRLQRACDDLTNSSMTVNEISDRTGFTNSSYFYLVFKKYLGCTPTQYRSNCQEENQ